MIASIAQRSFSLEVSTATRPQGEESSRNIFYAGAAPNQQAIPAVRYLCGGCIEPTFKEW